MAQRHNRQLEAWALFSGGLASAAGIVLVATGRVKEASAFGVAGALLGASVGAFKILGRGEPVEAPTYVEIQDEIAGSVVE